jgi:hypothetical protein
MILGVPAGVVGRLAGFPPWLVIVVVAASLILGLVQRIVPQDSADRLYLLLALRRSRQGKLDPGITVTGHATDDQDPNTEPPNAAAHERTEGCYEQPK